MEYYKGSGNQRVVGATITTTGYADVKTVHALRNVVAATARAQALNARLGEMTSRVKKTADVLIGTHPECATTGDYPAAPQPDGQVHELHAALDDYERVVVALEAEVNRLIEI